MMARHRSIQAPGLRLPPSRARWRRVAPAPLLATALLAASAPAAEYTGHVTGEVQPGSYCNGTELQPLRYARVVVEGLGETFTDSSGSWNAGEGVGERTVTITLDGPYVDVQNHDGTDAQLVGVASPGVPMSAHFDDTSANRDERDVFAAIADVHDFVEVFDPGFPFTNTQIAANVGIDLSCGASWNGELHFYRESTCANTGEIQSVVLHEYGHGLQDALLGGTQGDQGLGEGNGDALANLLTGDPEIARGFFVGDCTGGIRSSDNALVYPDDVIGEPPHDAGRVIAGFHWDLLESFVATTDESAGAIAAGERWHFARKLEQPTLQPDQVLAMYVADDDNGNLADGTPNCALIDAAAIAHGFPPLCELVGTPVPGPPGPTPPRLVASPNPARSGSGIRFALERAGGVSLALYDVRGRLVRALVDGTRAAGVHEVVWDGRDSAGRRVGAGVYTLRLHTGSQVHETKVIRLR